jgi:hypothetical protein
MCRGGSPGAWKKHCPSEIKSEHSELGNVCITWAFRESLNYCKGMIGMFHCHLWLVDGIEIGHHRTKQDLFFDCHVWIPRIKAEHIS